jgi:O-antigen chain-terminating methyltransferase
MSGDFYRAFEDRYRGSRAMIGERLQVYLPFVAPLADAGAETRPAALDLGCGRGEWLELLGKHGFAARGVDLDDGMLAACRERGLEVETADAIGSLRALPDNSMAVVSAFHLVEHLPFDAVQALVEQSLRVLQPGGLLIMETPNPENPMVGACRFYLDPSHERPIPPNLLSFMTEHAGFARQKVLPLQEDPQLHTAPVHLINVLDGASPDYGVVAQKAAGAGVLEQFDLPFGRAFGIGITELAQRFEEGQQAALSALAERQQRQAAETNARLAETDAMFPKMDAAMSDLEALIVAADARSALLGDGLVKVELRLAKHEAQLAETSLRIAELQAQMATSDSQHEVQHNAITSQLAELHLRMAAADARQLQKEQELTELRSRIAEADTLRAQKEAEVAMLHGQLNAVFDSTSWRLTAPLRGVRRLFGPRR